MARALVWMRKARSGPEGVAEVTAALTTSADEEEARLAALALARAGALEGLAEGLTGTDASREASLMALDTLDGEAVGRIALDAASGEAQPWRRRRLVALALRRGVDAAGLWEDALPPVRAAILEAGAAEDLVEEALGAEDAEVAWLGCVQAGRADDLGLAGALEQALEHSSPFVRAQAARALVGLGLTPAVDALDGLWREDVPLDLEGVRALDDRDAADVERAALALLLASDADALQAAVGRLAASSTPAATEALVAGTDHPRPAVRAAALRGLDGRVGETVWAAYDGRVRQDPDPAVRTGAVWTVAQRRELEALDWIVGWTTDPSVAVRQAAVEGLGVRVRRTRRARTEAVKAALQAARAAASDAGQGAIVEAADAALGRFPG